ncbi:cutinase family protein [Rhodococcus erythropolis]|uniref:cutinase family protein n=1 Tax=Rhodococcus erythropolis TaxID=1833 RepID=UPI0029494587|nr:cutinase family protein [Rhodococcus erythropolis]MDV6277543.1 cutinase family protein [Rhodococcus erythropolis]
MNISSTARFASAFAIIAALVAGLAAPLLANAAPPAASGCTRYIGVFAPGTTETRADADPSKPAGMLGQVGRKLEAMYGPNTFRAIYPSYPAEAFLQSGMTYSASKTAGDQAMATAMEQCPNSKFVIGGYSQGAQVAGDVAVTIGAGSGPVPAASVLAAVMLANPKLGTAGSQVVGPKLDGQGIAGPAAEGYGALSGRVFDICHPEDKYCNTNTGKDSFLASLGRVLANPPGTVAPTTATAVSATTTPSVAGQTAATPTDTVAKPTSTPAAAGTANTSAAAGTSNASEFLGAVTSNYGYADLAAAPGAASALATSVEKLQSAGAPTSTSAAVDVAAVRQQAQLLAGTFKPVQQTQAWMAANPAARDGLRNAPADSPEAATNSVLGALDKVDVPQVLGAADQVVTLANSILSGGAAGTGGTYTGLTGPAQSLSNGVAPLADTPTDQLTTATSILSAIRPVTIINQILGVVSGAVSVDYNAVAANLQILPGHLLAGNVTQAHRVAGELNNQLSPLVKMAAGVDLKSVSRILALIPDPSGTAASAALVANLLGNVDIIRLARDVGQLQEVAWQVAETGNVLALGQLLPIGVDLANVALGVLTPGQKMTADQLHEPADSMTTLMGAQAQNSDFVGLGNSVLATVTSQDAQALTSVVAAGFTAASFLGSRVHESYGQWLIDGKRTALDAMVDIYRQAIGG